MKKQLTLLCCASALLLSAAEIGAPAPELKIRKFVKGDPVTLSTLKDKKILILHFWATKCKPCNDAIENLNRIAQKYADKGVEVLAIGSDDPTAIIKAPELARMKYRVASDDMIKTADAYLRPGDRLPTDAIIGKDGKLLWIGPSVALPVVLDEILNNRYDLAGAIELDRFNAGMAKAAQTNDFKGALKLMDARLAKTPDDAELISMRAELLSRRMKSPTQALASLAEAIARNPKAFKLHETRLQLLFEQGEKGRPVLEAYQLIAHTFADQPMILVELSEALMRRPVGDFQLLSVYTLARAAYTKGKFANNRERGRAAAALARSYYYIGMLDKAVQLEKEALVLLKGSPDEKRATFDLQYYHNARMTAEQVKELEKEQSK